MKRTFLAALMVFTVLTLAGCGESGTVIATATSGIFTDQAVDGDIAKDPVTGAFTVTQGMSLTVQSVFAGIDPATLTEFRAFLDFPLRGVGGVPANAAIASAALDLEINGILPQPLTGSLPIRIDLVSLQPPLGGVDFDSTPLAAAPITFPVFQTDVSNHVSVDVTALMVEAQRLGLTSFQIRLSEDPAAVSPGRIEINDATGANREVLAPLLQVTYF